MATMEASTSTLLPERERQRIMSSASQKTTSSGSNDYSIRYTVIYLSVLLLILV